MCTDNDERHLPTCVMTFGNLLLSPLSECRDFPQVEDTRVLNEFLDGALLELEAAQAADPKDHTAVALLDFALRVVIPSLTAFFKSLTRRRNTKAAQAFMSGTTLRIFHCLCEFAKKGLSQFSFVDR